MADQTLSQEEKNKKLEELADQMVEGTEGVATSSEDVLSQDDTQDIETQQTVFWTKKV